MKYDYYEYFVLVLVLLLIRSTKYKLQVPERVRLVRLLLENKGITSYYRMNRMNP